MNYRDWMEHELSVSTAWHARVDARRSEAMKPRRTASGYSIASYRDLTDVIAGRESWLGLDRAGRAYAWSEERVERRLREQPRADPAPNATVKHLSRWERGLLFDERRYIGATAACDLHHLYCSPSGYVPTLVSSLALYRAPAGGQASLAAAWISGASWGTVDARKQAFRRVTPIYQERFSVILKPTQAVEL